MADVIDKVLIVAGLTSFLFLVLYLGSRLVGAAWFRSKREFYEKYFPRIKGKEKGEL